MMIWQDPNGTHSSKTQKIPTPSPTPMVRKFDNAIVTFYTLTPQRVEGTIVQGKTVLYTEIKAGFWRASRSY